MGVGKSTVGKLLANSLNYPFIDLDELIEKNHGLTVSEIFKVKGEDYFREMEYSLLIDLLSKDKHVIALGGGSLENAKISSRIRSSALLVYLEASEEFLYHRLKNEKMKRPLIAAIEDKNLIEFISSHLEKRVSNYQKAHLKVNVENKSPEEVLSFLTEYLDLS